MRARLLGFAFAFCAACSGGSFQLDAGPDVATSDDASAIESGADAGALGHLRVANMTGDQSGGPAIDFCLISGGAPAVPYFSSIGQSNRLAIEHVSAYVAIAPGKWTIRFVPAASSDCTPAPIKGAMVADVEATVDGDSWATAVVVGGASGASSMPTPLAVDLRADEHGATAHVHARLLNASPYLDTPSIKLGTSVVYPIAPYAKIPMGGDDRGYIDADPEMLMNGNGLGFLVGVQAKGWAYPISVKISPLATGEVLSMFLFGKPDPPGSLNASQIIVVCNDIGSFEGSDPAQGESDCRIFTR